MIQATVRGMKFTEPSIELWKQLEEDVELILEREPGNKYDENAVKVVFKDFHLGYVDKKNAEIVSKKLDEGKQVKAVITRVFGMPSYRPHIEIDIHII